MIIFEFFIGSTVCLQINLDIIGLQAKVYFLYFNYTDFIYNSVLSILYFQLNF